MWYPAARRQVQFVKDFALFLGSLKTIFPPCVSDNLEQYLGKPPSGAGAQELPLEVRAAVERGEGTRGGPR